jgi:hypothetical protein
MKSEPRATVLQMRKSKSIPGTNAAKKVTDPARYDHSADSGEMGTFLTGVDIESPIRQKRTNETTVPESTPFLDLSMQTTVAAPTPTKKSLLGESLSMSSGSGFVDPLERLWFKQQSSALLETPQEPAIPALLEAPLDIFMTGPVGRKNKLKRKKKKKKRKQPKNMTTNESILEVSSVRTRRAETVVSSLRARKKYSALYSSSGSLSRGAQTAPTLLFKGRARKPTNLHPKKSNVVDFDARQEDDAERRLASRNDAAQRSIRHIRRMRAWEREMKLKQVKLKWFKIAFIPACERIQVSLKRNHAFQIWREDMLAQREQGEKLTRSLERISIFKAFRTWKLDMLFLKAMEHGVITVRDIITKHKWNKFFQLWKEWNEFFKKKAATVKPRKSTASTADEIARERRRNVGGAFEGVGMAVQRATMRLALRDWHTWITTGLPEAKNLQRQEKFWAVVGKCVRTAGTWRSFEKWQHAVGMKAMIKPTLRLKRPKKKGRSTKPKILVTELDKVRSRVRARVDAGEEARLKMLAREIMKSTKEFSSDKDADRITLNIDMPSGGTSLLFCLFRC